MFRVAPIDDRNADKIYVVYSVNTFDGLIMFLIYDGYMWRWVNAEKYKPYSEVFKGDYSG